jgi:hypothetical protein
MAATPALILAFVRGGQSWEMLKKAGIYIELSDDRYEIDNPWQVTVEASLRDVAQGLLSSWRSPDQLRGWAGIILAGSSFLELSEEFEATPEGDILLSSLWDAAFGDEVGQDAMNIAKDLAGEGWSREDIGAQEAHFPGK